MALAIAKLARLRKQKTFLRNRKKEIIRRGLRYLDKLDTLEEKERKEHTLVEKNLESSFELGVLEFDPNFDYSLAKESSF